jgi:flavin-dependent dehydrogenase
MNTHPVKVTVVGGGPAGLATALTLLSYSYDVTVVERTDYNRVCIGEHLPPAAITCLQQLQAYEQLFSDKHRFCHGIRSAWSETYLTDSSYIFSPEGEGINLSRPEFDSSLAELARQRGAQVLTNSQIQKLTYKEDKWYLELTTPAGVTSLNADFLVDASGRSAKMAQMLGEKMIAYDKLIGFIGFMAPCKNTNSNIEENLLLEAVEHGWWYTSHLKNGITVGAYMTDSDYVLKHPITVWKKCLSKTIFIKERLRAFQLPDKVEVCSARSQLLSRSTGIGWLAVGDAVMSFDPVSSQGIFKGLKDGIQAAQAIHEYLNGHSAALKQLETDRYRVFREYLQMRAKYYRMVARWPSSPFWQRRHCLLPSETPVSIDPMISVVASKTVNTKHVRQFLKEKMPWINGELLISLAQSPQPAHCLVTRLKEKMQGQLSDRELIITVQALLAAGIFVEDLSEN